jgi:hypothetical protein
MGTIVLKDASGVPAGFLMFAGAGPTSDTDAHDCIVSGPPFPGPESAAREFIQSRKNIEFSAQVRHVNGGVAVKLIVGPNEILEVETGDSSPNQWRAVVGGVVAHTGPCEELGQ